MASTYELIVEVVDKTSKPINDVNKALSNTNKRAMKVNATVKKMNSTFKTIGSAGLKGLGSLTRGLRNVGIAAIAAAGGFAFMAKSTLNQLDLLGKVASKLGTTTEFLSTFQVIADRAGIGMETTNMALQRFFRRLGEAQMGTGELLKPLKMLNIAIKDGSGNFRKQEDVLADFFQALRGVEDSTIRTALAMKGFDSEGVAMVNIANMTAKEIAQITKHAKEAGLVISEDLTKSAEGANDALKELFQFGTGFRNQFFGALSGAITDLTNLLKEKLKVTLDASGGMKAFANDIASAFLKGTSEFIQATAKFVDNFKVSFATFTNILKELIVQISKVIPNFEAAFGDQAEVTAKLNLDMKEAEEKIKKLQKIPQLGTSMGVSPIAIQIATLENEIADIEKSLKSIEEGSTVFFSRVKVDADATQKGVEKVVTDLNALADNLKEIADAERKANEIRKAYPVYEDQILRAHKAQEKLNDQININLDAGKEKKILTFADHYKQMTEAVEKNVKIQQFNAQILNEIESLYARGMINLSTYTEFKKQLGVETKEVAKNFRQLLNELKENSTETVKSRQENMKLFQALVQTGAGADILKEAMSSLNIAVEDLPFEQQLAHYQQLITLNKETEASTLKLRDALLAEGHSRKELEGVGFSFKEKELTFNQELTKQYKDQVKELENVEKALANVSALAKEARVSEAFLTEELMKQKEQLEAGLGMSTPGNDLVKSIQEQHKQLKELQDALLNVGDLAKQAGVSQEFLTEKIKEQMEALEIYKDRVKTTNEIIEEGFQGISKSLSKELGTAIRTGESLLGALENVFTRTLDNILQKILESQIEQALGGLFGGLGGGGGGFSLGNLFGTPTVGAPMGGFKLPFFANGGIAKKGQPSIVGDGGEPELFIPGKTGRVTPMSDINTGNGSVNVNFNINAIDTQNGVEFLIQNKPQIIGMVTQGFNQRGRAGITS